MEKRFKLKPKSIQGVIEKSILLTSVFVFLIVFGLAIFFSHKSDISEKSRNAFQMNKVLATLIMPNLKIANSMSVIQTLGLISTQKHFFAVIDNKQNILLSDYGRLKTVKAFLSKYNPLICHRTSMQILSQNMNYDVSCYRIDSSNTINHSLKIGYLLNFSKSNSYTLLFQTLIYFLVLVILAFFLIFVLLRMILQRWLLKPFAKLLSELKRSSKSPITPSVEFEDNEAPKEIQVIRQEFRKVLKNLQLESEKLSKLSKKEAVYKLASQISHDIVSPLVALRVVANNLDELPEKKRLLLQAGVSQINDIANNLLKTNQNKETDVEESLKPVMLYSIIEKVVSEKQVTFSAKHPEINFNVKSPKALSKAFVRVVSAQMISILSNLINNSIDALAECSYNGKTITLKVLSSDEAYVVEVIDNGPGIKPDRVGKLFHEGVSYKKKGHGLGLYNARKFIHSWGGQIDIESKWWGAYTRVKISLPKVSPPEWFCLEVICPGVKRVVLVDDCQAMETLWRTKLEKYNIESIYFSCILDFENWFKGGCDKCFNKYSGSLFLIDFEFRGEKKNGLDLLKALEKEKHVYLVTSKASDDFVQSECIKLNRKILPKFYVPEVGLVLK